VFDDTWRTFRDRFGFVWSALVREMFNNAARNAQWPATLGWSGLRGEVEEEKALATLRALLGRFEEEEVSRQGARDVKEDRADE
jgi:hypothetical protein